MFLKVSKFVTGLSLVESLINKKTVIIIYIYMNQEGLLVEFDHDIAKTTNKKTFRIPDNGMT
jgi:hypothetical protein